MTADGGVSAYEIYDHEIDKIHRTLEELRRKAESPQNYQSFQDEIKGRFADLGFVVDVKWWDTNVEGVLMPEIEITGRTEAGFVFDRDQQVHEVTGDMLGLGQGGVIKSSEGMAKIEQHKH
jgi:hypothetical protein